MKIRAHIIAGDISSNSSEAFTLYKKSHFGEPSGEKIRYSLPEALFLAEKGKIEIISGKKKLAFRDIMKKAGGIDKRINTRYAVFKNLRKKGYIVKTALKFGADFRVYDRGFKPGEKHAKWVVFADNESKRLTWHEFSAKNRVAHSTKKTLLLAIVDEEGDVSYYEVRWMRP